MSVLHHSDRPESPAEAGGALPLVTWQEPLAYEVVELPVEESTHVKTSLPPLDMVVRPRFEDVPDIATPEEREQAAFRVASLDDSGDARVLERRNQEVRLQELLAYSRRIRRPRRPAGRPLETHWYQCLVLPFVAWRLLISLGGGLALGILLALPFEGDTLIPWHVRYVVALVFVVWVCGYLQCVLNGAVRGDPPAVCWPGRYIDVALRFTGRWTFCFLAGPAPVAMVAVLYWIYCGELEFLDWIILAQAGVFVVSYFLFALLAVSRSQRLYDANPVRVAQLVQSLGYRAAILIVLTSLLSFAHGSAIVSAIGVAHENAIGGWFLLTLSMISGLACATFLLRLAGLWSFRHAAPRP